MVSKIQLTVRGLSLPSSLLTSTLGWSRGRDVCRRYISHRRLGVGPKHQHPILSVYRPTDQPLMSVSLHEGDPGVRRVFMVSIRE